jgi:cytochrome P450
METHSSRSSISSTRSYRQILLESFADRFPGWMVDVVLSLPIRNGRMLRHQLDVMQSTSADLFKAGLADAQMDQQARKDLLSVLVKANLDSSPKLQLKAEEVQAQLMTFIMAGWGTVLSVLANFIRQLSTHLEVQDRLRTELLGLGAQPSVEQLQRAPYLDAVLKEAIRVVGVTPLERIATRDDLLPLSKPIQLVNGSYANHLPIRKGQSLRYVETRLLDVV